MARYRNPTRKGRPNLKKLSRGRVENKYGITFTKREQKLLISEVRKSNYRRDKILKEEAQMDLYVGGKKLGASVSDSRMGRESDFVYMKKSQSLHKFKTKEEYWNYINNLRRVNKPNYLVIQARLYKNNFIIAMRNQGFSDEVIKAVERLTGEEFLELSRTDIVANFGFIYDKERRYEVEQALLESIKRIKGQ